MKYVSILALKSLLSKWYIKLLLSIFMFIIIMWVLVANSDKLVAHIIERSLSDTLDRDIKVEKLEIGSDSINAIIRDEYKNELSIDGRYSIFTLKSHGNILLKYHDNNITIDGALLYSATPKTVVIDGDLDTLDGDVNLYIKMIFLKIAELKADVNGVSYQKIMDILEIANDNDTKIDAKIDIKSDRHNNIKANIDLKTTTKYLKHLVIEQGEDSNVSLKELLSDSDGNIRDFHIDCTINYDIDNLGILDQFAMKSLNSSSSGVIKIDGNTQSIDITTSAKISNFDIDAGAKLSYLQIVSSHIKSANVDLDKLFFVLDTPSIASGKLTFDIQIDTNEAKLDAFIKRGVINSKTLAKYYGITQPQNIFDAHIDAKIGDNKSVINVEYNSNQAKMKFEDSVDSFMKNI